MGVDSLIELYGYTAGQFDIKSKKKVIAKRHLMVAEMRGIHSIRSAYAVEVDTDLIGLEDGSLDDDQWYELLDWVLRSTPLYAQLHSYSNGLLFVHFDMDVAVWGDVGSKRYVDKLNRRIADNARFVSVLWYFRCTTGHSIPERMNEKKPRVLIEWEAGDTTLKPDRNFKSIVKLECMFDTAWRNSYNSGISWQYSNTPSLGSFLLDLIDTYLSRSNGTTVAIYARTWEEIWGAMEAAIDAMLLRSALRDTPFGVVSDSIYKRTDVLTTTGELFSIDDDLKFLARTDTTADLDEMTFGDGSEVQPYDGDLLGESEGEMKENPKEFRLATDDESVDSGIFLECNGVRQCYEEEHKLTKLALKLCETTAYRVQQRVYRMTTAKESGEPSDYEDSEELNYDKHSPNFIRCDDKYYVDTDGGHDYDLTRNITPELVIEESTCTCIILIIITWLRKSFVHHYRCGALQNQLQENETSLAFIHLARLSFVMGRLPRSAFTRQDLATFLGKWIDEVKVASPRGAVHTGDDTGLSTLGIIYRCGNYAVITDSAIDGEREITSTTPVMNTEQSYEEEWIKLGRQEVLAETILSHDNTLRRVVHCTIL